jgi:hypothetical protein
MARSTAAAAARDRDFQKIGPKIFEKIGSRGWQRTAAALCILQQQELVNTNTKAFQKKTLINPSFVTGSLNGQKKLTGFN